MTDKFSVICEWTEDGEKQWDCVTQFDKPVAREKAQEVADKLKGSNLEDWGDIPHSFKVISFDNLQERLKLEGHI